jgi:hypothetical protein
MLVHLQCVLIQQSDLYGCNLIHFRNHRYCCWMPAFAGMTTCGTIFLDRCARDAFQPREEGVIKALLTNPCPRKGCDLKPNSLFFHVIVSENLSSVHVKHVIPAKAGIQFIGDPQAVICFHKSFQCGLFSSISFSFHERRHFFSRFSRVMALSMSSNCSK